MYSKDQLITDRLPPLTDNFLHQLATDIHQGQFYQGPDPYTVFVQLAQEYFLSTKLNQLSGLEKFEQVDIVIGCNHFIDNLILKHGLDGLQIFEYDYRYYSRLNPKIKYAELGNLVPGKPLLIAAPFPGALDLHRNWSAILDECEDKQIPVHLDCSWLGSASGIVIDFDRPCIHSVAMSLSKGLGMDWNRVGLRWSRRTDPTDSITIMNHFGMIPHLLVRAGITAVQQVPVDYLWNTYGKQYHDICKQLQLRPGKIIHAAMSLDRRQLYGLLNFFVKKTGTV